MGKVIDNQDVPTDTQALTFDSASGEWKAEDGGGGSAEFVIGQHMFDLLLDSTIEHGSFFSQVAFTASENQREWIAPMAFTLKNFVVDVDSNTNADVTVFTVRLNLASTALTLTYEAGISGKMTVTTDVSIAKDDTLSMRGDNSLNTESIRVMTYSCRCTVP